VYQFPVLQTGNAADLNPAASPLQVVPLLIVFYDPGTGVIDLCFDEPALGDPLVTQIFKMRS